MTESARRFLAMLLEELRGLHVTWLERARHESGPAQDAFLQCANDLFATLARMGEPR